MKYSAQNSTDKIVIIAVTTAIDMRENGYYEQVAIGYNTADDNLEAVILSRGNGCGDDRVLCENDADETISAEALFYASVWIRGFSDNHPHCEELQQLADYVYDQAVFASTPRMAIA